MWALRCKCGQYRPGDAEVSVTPGHVEHLRGRIAELEAALREIADFSEQFIGDDEDGDERMYKVNQIADTVLNPLPRKP